MLTITTEYREAITAALLNSYFNNFDRTYLQTEAGKEDLEKHVCSRMLEVEQRVIPWVSDVFSLDGLRVLEIGCGTGSSTIPFALRASELHTCDINLTDIGIAKRRAELFNIRNASYVHFPADWARVSADEGLSSFPGQFDAVLMIALLEHLTIEERLNVLRTSWAKLRDGGILVVYETPNRLGYFDWHSFLLPFFNMLPDELALSYQAKTPRQHFAAKDSESLYRLGRGVGYHEFDLAIGLENMNIVNDGFSKHLNHRHHNARYEEALIEIFAEHLPSVQFGFSLSSLDLVIKKGPAIKSHRPRSEHERLLEENANLQQQLTTIYSSGSWRLLQQIRNTKLYKLSTALLHAATGRKSGSATSAS